MVAQLHSALTEPTTDRPVVVVGAGPVGVRFVQELHRREPTQRIVLYGAEPQEPYNRVRLSSLLAGELQWDTFQSSAQLPPTTVLERRFGCAVKRIDRIGRTVVDARGAEQPYAQLVLATGSTPHIPNIPNVALSGVYTFRDFRDAQRLLARSVRSRRTVVIGAGLLGLEAARAMRRFNTEVVVIDHAARVMHRQLDEEAAERLTEHLARLRIGTILGDYVRTILGQERVSGVLLASGATLECDTIVVAAGIRPSIELARSAGISVGRGVRVDDHLRTSDPAIFAIGECAEHREIVYGLAAPGFEQAAIAAACVVGQPASYTGSIAATRLKVVGLPVFSMGRVASEDLARDAREWTHRSGSIYCKVVTERRRIVGAVAIGEPPQLGQLQEAVSRMRRASYWRLARFQRRGVLWADAASGSVAEWPTTATVCNCTGVTRGQLSAALACGHGTPLELARITGASSVCGSCSPLLQELCGLAATAAPPLRGRAILIGVSLVAALAALLFASNLNVDYAKSALASVAWDPLWRDSFWKQASGYSTLALSAAALVLSLRKRIRRFSFGEFGAWRIVHVALGAATLAALLAHTGGRLGARLNLLLMASFLLVVLLGAASGALTALEHLSRRFAVQQQRRRAVWAHVLVFWPAPALLGVHICKSYFF